MDSSNNKQHRSMNAGVIARGFFTIQSLLISSKLLPRIEHYFLVASTGVILCLRFTKAYSNRAANCHQSKKLAFQQWGDPFGKYQENLFISMAPRRTRRTIASTSASSDQKDDIGGKEGVEPNEPSPPSKKRIKKAETNTTKYSKNDMDETSSTKRRAQTTRKPSKKTTVKSSSESIASDQDTNARATLPTNDSPTRTASRVKTPPHQVLTDRDTLPKLWSYEQAKANGSYPFVIATWNVAGLRALLKKNPNVLAELCQRHNLDVLCLQETKLQEQHLDDPKLGNIRETLLTDQYDAYYSCSTGKKGYSGTAVFVKRRGKAAGKKSQQMTLNSFVTVPTSTKQDSTSLPTTSKNLSPNNCSSLIPIQVTMQLGIPEHDAEGRIITVKFPTFTLINVYVPNSGMNLERLTYRTERWDKDLLSYVQRQKEEGGTPVMWLGDLNVAHTNLEVWNDGAKHLPKQAGVTPEERASFQAQLNAGFVDAFRSLHPDAKGHYTYWSQRAGNRAPNKGLRLDYFVCDPLFFDESSKVIVRDSYMDFDQQGSDHCPAILCLEINS